MEGKLRQVEERLPLGTATVRGAGRGQCVTGLFFCCSAAFSGTVCGSRQLRQRAPELLLSKPAAPCTRMHALAARRSRPCLAAARRRWRAAWWTAASCRRAQCWRSRAASRVSCSAARWRACDASRTTWTRCGTLGQGRRRRSLLVFLLSALAGHSDACSPPAGLRAWCFVRGVV